jgi:aryl-alcohol dehydrogenase-like predicted oxidoreductase
MAGRGALQPDRARRADRQVPARPEAAAGHACRPGRQAHDGNRVPRGIAADRAALQQHCEARGIKLGQFATAWVLANSAISSVIAGPRTLAQMEDYYDAVEMKISAEEEALVDSLVTGHASTHGYNDPNYPFFGRVVRG